MGHKDGTVPWVPITHMRNPISGSWLGPGPSCCKYLGHRSAFERFLTLPLNIYIYMKDWGERSRENECFFRPALKALVFLKCYCQCSLLYAPILTLETCEDWLSWALCVLWARSIPSNNDCILGGFQVFCFFTVLVLKQTTSLLNIWKDPNHTSHIRSGTEGVKFLHVIPT